MTTGTEHRPDAADDHAPILYSLTYRAGIALDDVAVMRACEGDASVTLTQAELAEAYARLRARGYPIKEAAEILGMGERRAGRWEAKYGGAPTRLDPRGPAGALGRPAGRATKPPRAGTPYDTGGGDGPSQRPDAHFPPRAHSFPW